MQTTNITNPAQSTALLRSESFRQRVRRLIERDAPRLRRLMAYYQNPLRACPVGTDDAGSARPYRLGQEWGLPSRITGVRVTSMADCFQSGGTFAAQAVPGVARKEVVIENDIAWRVDTLVDYLFGKPIVITSAAPERDRRSEIEQLLRLIIAHNGGIEFLQQLALMGAVHGFVDVLVKLEPADDSSHAQDESGGVCGAPDLGQKPTPIANRADLGSPAAREPGGYTGDSDHTAVAAATHTAASPSSNSNDESSNHAPQEGDVENSTARGTAPGASHPSHEARSTLDIDALSRLARRVRLEIVEPARALPLLSSQDYRCVDAYAQVYEAAKTPSERPALRVSSRRALGLFGRLRSRAANLLPGFVSESSCDDALTSSSDDRALVIDLITPTSWHRYENGACVASGSNSLGRVPLVHVQNTPTPFEYAGVSDVEPLIPLQDELNTRMSDRAYRITMQSFKMYLAKGIDGVDELPVGPGRVWVTDNENAEITAFGGDVKTFSEDNHIADVRQALDKISGVTPIAAGAIKGRIGRLTSAAALRVTMLALLAKTERRRTIYGRAIEQICELALAWLDVADLYPSSPADRAIQIHWPSPIPVNEGEQLQQAQAKLGLGVPQEIVLRELGY